MLVKLLVSEGLGITWLVQVLVLLATIGRALTLRSVELHLLLVNEPSGGVTFTFSYLPHKLYSR